MNGGYHRKGRVEENSRVGVKVLPNTNQVGPGQSHCRDGEVKIFSNKASLQVPEE